MNGVYKEGAKQTPDHQGPAGLVISPNGTPSLPGELFLFCQGDRDGQTCGGFGVLSLTIPGGGIGFALHPLADRLAAFRQPVRRHGIGARGNSGARSRRRDRAREGSR